MSIYKRVSGNLVVQTVGNTDSITFQGVTANTATVIIDGNLSVSGNVALTGNIAGDKIFNGTTSIEIPVASGNANISVSGTANVFVANSAGIAVAGTASASGNVTGANINTGGLVSATGNVNGGNLNITTGNIVLTRSSTATTSPTIRFTDSNTAVSSLGANIGSFEWFTSDATGAAARVTAAVKAVYADASGNANVLIQTASGASLTNRIVVLGATGNVGVANSAPLHTLAVTGTMYGSSTLDIVGNVAGGNVSTAGLVTATGNVTGSNINTGGLITATGNIAGGNISAAGGIIGGAGGVSVTGNVTGGNLIINGTMSASGNLTTTNISATTLDASANITGGNIKTTGISNVGTSIVTGTQTVTGNITGANVNTGILSASGNILGLNVNTGLVSATGNVVSGAGGYFIGDGGYLSNITVVSNIAVSQLANGTSNWTIRGSGGSITGDVGGSANVAILSGSGFTLTGFMSAAGNVTGANVNTGGLISATGNIIGGNVSGATGTFTTVIGNANATSLTTGTVPSDRLTGQYTININGSALTANTVTINAQPNITSVGTLTVLSVSGNVISSNAASNNSFAGNVGIGTTAPAAQLNVVGTTIISNVNVLNASYDSISLSVAAQGSIPTGLFFSADGSKMFVSNSAGAGDDVDEYVLSTPWVVSSATYSTLFSVAGQDTVPAGLFFRADGLKMYVVGQTNDTVFQYALTSPWSVATASYESISFSVAAQELTPSGIFFKPDGLSMYITGSTSDGIYQYTLSTAWNVSTATYLQTFSQAQDTAPQDLSFTGDGTRMFMLGSTGDDVNVYNLTTPWNISTATSVGAFSVSAQEDFPTGFYIKPDGTKMYVVGATNDTVFQYSVPSVEIQLTGTTAINGSATVAQDLTVYGDFNTSGNVTGGNINTGAQISATGNIVGGNITTGGLISATGNITTGGLISATGNITSGNLTTAGLITATGNITGSFIVGNGSLLSSITGANVTGTVANATFATSAGSATTAGTVTTAAQGNITSVGTLTSLAVTGNVTSGNLSGTSIVGTLITNAQPNITSVGTLTSLAVTGNITGGNLIISGSILDSSQLDIQTTAGNANIVLTPNGTGNVNVSRNIMPTANATANIGSATLSFNTLFATATSAQYADLAEKFRADAVYEPGTVLTFGGTQEVTISTQDTDRRVAGVVSTNPSYLMNSGLNDEFSVAIALQGRVPCRVVGPVRKGDMMVSANNGRAKTHQDPPTGSIIGKSLENFDGETGTIEIVVGRD